jgi:hypothetical protein
MAIFAFYLLFVPMSSRLLLKAGWDSPNHRGAFSVVASGAVQKKILVAKGDQPQYDEWREATAAERVLR